jgi:acetoin utilization deacetylase AcuC-like enzyme
MDSNIDEIYETMEKLSINPIGYVFDERMLQHKDHSNTHPERPERAMVIYSNLIAKGYNDKLVRIEATEVTDDELKYIYGESYVKTISDLQFEIDKEGNKVSRKKTDNKFSLCYDTYDNYATYDSARVSAGCLLRCCKAIVKEEVGQAFAIIRPPGHHANTNECRGFCFFNNVALSVEYLKAAGYKVAIVDWDAHHGDGTQEIFYEKQNPLFISLHRHDGGLFYPNKTGKTAELGKGEGLGYNINIPWNNQCYKGDKSFIGDDEYFYAFDNIVLPALREYKPDIILVSCGFDAAENDPLGKMSLTPIGYSYMTNALRKVCNKVIIALEGGYNLNSLSRCSEAIIRTLLREETPFKGLLLNKEIESLNMKLTDLNENYFSPSKKVIKELNAVRSVLKPYWKCFESEVIPPTSNSKTDNEVIIAELTKSCENIQSFILPIEISQNDNIRLKVGRARINEHSKNTRKINIENRTTLPILDFRVDGVRLREYTNTEMNLYNWKGKEGSFNVYEKDIPLIIQKFIKNRKLTKDNFLDKLNPLIEAFEKLEYDFKGIKVHFVMVDKVVEKLSSTRNKMKPELEVFISNIHSGTCFKDSESKAFIAALKKLSKLIENEVL